MIELLTSVYLFYYQVEAYPAKS